MKGELLYIYREPEIILQRAACGSRAAGWEPYYNIYLYYHRDRINAYEAIMSSFAFERALLLFLFSAYSTNHHIDIYSLNKIYWILFNFKLVYLSVVKFNPVLYFRVRMFYTILTKSSQVQFGSSLFHTPRITNRLKIIVIFPVQSNSYEIRIRC